MFDHLIVSSSRRRGGAARTLTFSLILHGSVLIVLVTAPLMFYRQLPGTELMTDLIFARPAAQPPAPPPSPPPTPEPVRRPSDQPPVVRLPPMVAPPPAWIPEAPDETGNLDGLPYLSTTSPAGIGPGVGTSPIEGLAGWERTVAPQPPPPLPTPHKEPRRVGSTLQSARLIRKIDPLYPPLARTARIQGVVSLEVRIDEEGNVASVDVLSGPPLLREAAVTAVRQWKYSPTILNGEPYPVLANVTVRFVLR